MNYRGERDALRGRVENLEQALDEARRKLQAKQGDDKVAGLAELEPADAAAITREVAAESRARARVTDRMICVVLTVVGVFALAVCAPFAVSPTYVSGGIRHTLPPPEGIDRIFRLIPTVSAWAVALGTMIRGYRRRKHEEWLRTSGIQLRARVVNVERRTDLRFGWASDYRLLFEVAGPRGLYDVACDVDVPLPPVAALSGAEVSVRANPRNLKDILVEE